MAYKLLQRITVNKGDTVALFRKSGNIDVLHGPVRKVLLNTKVVPLRKFIVEPNQVLDVTYKSGEYKRIYGPISAIEDPIDGDKYKLIDLNRIRNIATPNEYIVVKYLDGTLEYVDGPAEVIFNPLKHEKITVEEPIRINKNEAIIVCEGGKVYSLIQGPVHYIPKPNTWIHEFVWSGHDEDKYKETGYYMKKSYGLRFKKLQMTPTQMYYDQPNNRTLDDALVVTKFMIFFEIKDIHEMLKNTNDPIANIINSMSSDITKFVSSRTFDLFKNEAHFLNDFDQFPVLLENAEKIGIRITKIAFKGYDISSAVQKMYNDAIEIRTKFELDKEKKEKDQYMINYVLEEEHKRALRQQELETDNMKHKMSLVNMEKNTELSSTKLTQEQQLKYYQSLTNMGIDVNKFLEKVPEKYIKIVSENPKAQTKIVI